MSYYCRYCGIEILRDYKFCSWKCDLEDWIKNMDKIKIPQGTIDNAIKKCVDRINKKTEKNGGYMWTSPHEIYGKKAEEEHELMKEMHKNNDEAFTDELIDCAVASIWGIASMAILKDIKK